MLRRDDALAGRRGYKLDVQGKTMKAFYEIQKNNKINVLSENMVSKSCLKLHDYHDQWFNAEGIYAFFFLQSISTNPKDMFSIVSSSTKRLGCLPQE